MKLWGWMLAAVVAGSGVAAAPAAAEPYRTRVVEKTTYYEGERKWRESDRKWSGSDRKWDNNDRKWDASDRKWDNSRRKWGWRTDCRTRWRYGHRERVCRNVRYRRW